MEILRQRGAAEAVTYASRPDISSLRDAPARGGGAQPLPRQPTGYLLSEGRSRSLGLAAVPSLARGRFQGNLPGGKVRGPGFKARTSKYRPSSDAL